MIKTKVASLNVPAIWSPIPAKSMNVRTYTQSIPVNVNGKLQVATEESPVYRYAKNFTKEGLTFSLCMFSNESKQSKVAAYFQNLLAKLSKQEIGKALLVASGSNFTYLADEYGVGI